MNAPRTQEEADAIIAALRADDPATAHLPDEVLAHRIGGDYRGAFLAWADAENVSGIGWWTLLLYLSFPEFNEDLRGHLREGHEDV